MVSVCSAANAVVIMRWSMDLATTSMNGTIQKSPGPCRPMKRPSLRTTARSHCCATRGERAASTPMTAAPATHVGDPVAAVSTMPIRGNHDEDQD